METGRSGDGTSESGDVIVAVCRLAKTETVRLERTEPVRLKETEIVRLERTRPSEAYFQN